MEGERATNIVPTHTAAECTTAECAAYTVRTRTTSMRAHCTTAPTHTTAVSGYTSTTVPAHTSSVAATTAVSTSVSTTTAVAATTAATVSATTMSTTTAATGGCNSWGKRDRCTDCGGDGNGHEGLSKHGSVSSRWRPTPTGADLSDAGLRDADRRLT
jgi:hypothetical protein